MTQRYCSNKTRTRQDISLLFTGTEPSSVTTAKNLVNAVQHATSTHPASTPSSEKNSIETRHDPDRPIPGPSNVTEKVCTNNQHYQQPNDASESESSPSDDFSEEETVDNSLAAAKCDRPLHERVDTRIQSQKEENWKVGGKWRSKIGQMEDPRPKAIIPIHAPKMERMTKAKLHALKQHAANAEAKKKDNLVSGIIYEMDKLKEINYSMALVRAEVIAESKMLPKKTVVAATNDPNSVRPKPPTVKLSREQKVLPFPKRRRQAFQREKQDAKKSRLSDSSEVCSDASWPTNKDEEIATFATKRVVKRKKPAAKKLPVKQQRKAVGTVKSKRVTKYDIASMLRGLQTPIDAEPCNPIQPSDCLDQATVKSLVKAQQARIRQKTYRARLALKKKAKEINGGQHNYALGEGDNSQDVLAQAINLSNILNTEDNDALDELLSSQILDSDDNAALDELIQEIAEEEEEARTLTSEQIQPCTSSSTQSSSSNSSGSSSYSSSSSDDSESDIDNDSEAKPSSSKHEITDDV